MTTLTTKPIVFVVDDDISVRESLKLVIEASGWQAETFASAKEFLAVRGPMCRAVWCWMCFCPTSAVWICRSVSPAIGPTCRSSSSPDAATSP